MRLRYFLIGFALATMTVLIYAGATNFGRLIVSEDPGITLSNGETISNSTDGTIDFGTAILSFGGTKLDSGSTVGVDAFTTTATADTVVISGALATDIYIVNGRGGSVDQQDLLQVEAKADTLIVHRLAAGASALSYNWYRITY